MQRTIMNEKQLSATPTLQQPQAKTSWSRAVLLPMSIAAAFIWLHITFLGSPSPDQVVEGFPQNDVACMSISSPYGIFPKANDPFQFIPCTDTTLPPALDDKHANASWASLFDPDPDNWSWGNITANETMADLAPNDPYAGRGIYLCGYLDVPLDYTNDSDSRIARLAVTKYQVSGLAWTSSPASSSSTAGHKSARTIVVEPGGPGGSGTNLVWRAAESDTEFMSEGQYDVLGWDPRGVNASLPAAACFPFNADRDRWSLLTTQYWTGDKEQLWAQLELADAWNNATFAACRETIGDLPRFVSTAFVARDVDQIRAALGEDELTGYFVSYGTGIGQTYANMFPDRVGRLVLDGTEYVRDHRLAGGFGYTALDNATDAWHDGFVGECVAAGPKHCALAKLESSKGELVTAAELETRVADLLASIAARPIPGYSAASGPSLITYSRLVGGLYQALYKPETWPGVAQALYDLELGNATLAASMLDDRSWQFQPPAPCPITKRNKVGSDELGSLVICADSYDAEMPDLRWWSSLWQNMTEKNWVAGDSRFYSVLPCRHFNTHFGSAAEVYRGDLNATLANPVLLIAEIYDPATPLRNGRRLLHEMGDNARLVVHHGYGHSSRADKSKCTDRIAKDFILHGKIPESSETDCYADEKPYQYAVKEASGERDVLTAWREHMREMASSHPGLVF